MDIPSVVPLDAELETLAPELSRRCPRCQATMPVSQFRRREKKRKGWRAWCRECETIEAGLRSPGYYDRRYTTPPGRTTYLFNCAKNRAEAKEIPFSLDRELIEKTIAEGVCAATGRPFKTKTKGPWVPSIDRKDPNGGYTHENTQIVAYIYNCAKNSFTHEDVVEFAKALLTKEGYTITKSQ